MPSIVRLPRSRRARVLVAGVVGIVALLVVHAVAVNLLLRARIEQALSRRPELLSVSWDSAWTIVPGVVHVRGLDIRKQNRHVQWSAHLDSARAHVSLAGLLGRRLSFGSIEGDGLQVHLRFRAGERPEDPEDARAWDLARAAEPPIEGWTNPPDPRPEILRPPDPGKKRWRYRFEDVDVSRLSDIWIGTHRFRGEARLLADLVDVKAKHLFELGDAELTEVRGDVTVRGEPLANGVAGSVACSISRQQLGGRAVEMLDDLDADVDVTGFVADLSLLDVHLRAIRGLSLHGGSGPVTAKVVLRDGRFAPGTHVRTEPSGIEAGVFAGLLLGDASVTWDVERDADGPLGRGKVTFDEYTLAYERAGAPHVTGENLRATVATRDLDVRKPFEDVELTVSVPSARVTSVAAYSRWLPKGAPFALTGGQGTIEGDLTLTPRSGHGHVRLDSEDVRVRADDMDLVGSLVVDAPLVAARPQDSWFDFSGTRVDVSDVSTASGGRPIDGWWARIDTKELQLSSGPGGMSVTGSGRATLRDSAPIVSAWATQAFVAKLFRGALTDRNVEMTTRFAAGRDGWSVDDLEVRGDRIVAFACLDVHPPSRRGAVYFDGGLLSVGIRLTPGGRDVTPLARRAWWERNREACP